MSLMSWFGVGAVSATEVRAEVWSLGVRHQGRALEGATAELKATGLTPARERLLKACVRKLKSA